ncbi:hypothetical protein [Streptomyces sp. NEAU-S77]|uniref:hypothetical protein n=1 Tax=Streptomyces sp. NEAU-S77 TaxID=3411033 RepID=UPI003BA3DAB8
MQHEDQLALTEAHRTRDVTQAESDQLAQRLEKRSEYIADSQRALTALAPVPDRPVLASSQQPPAL